MCSQPPREQDDQWLVDELMDAIPLISPETEQIGITGGEPGLLGERLITLVDALQRHLPRTALHILSNGRRFADRSFARSMGGLNHHDLVVGIPIYSDLPELHDYVVQARGAFDEAVRGIMNLKQARVRVEIRFVIHRETYERLPQFAEFVARNLVFADHVALMGLELMGFARANLESLWIDPLDYQGELLRAARILERARVPVSIYNHQLCVLAPVLHRLARRSISDWKNMYMEPCATCESRSDCGGFFASSALRVSRGIAPRTSNRLADASS
jgi:His-Xaa-Ser system radical SAM maturase HxsC